MRHVILLLLLCSAVAWADLGPKPTMTFQFQEIQALKVVSGALLQSSEPNGEDAKPLGQYGPQRFELKPDGAFAMAYGFAPYSILELTLADGRTLRSQVFSGTGLSSYYKVTVKDGKLRVEPNQKELESQGLLRKVPKPSP